MPSGLAALQDASIIARRLDEAFDRLCGTADDEHVALSVLVVEFI
jgi:hypothetical protein